MKIVDSICLNEKYSTTRLVIKEKPIIEKNPDDKFETVLFLPPVEGRKGEGGLRTQGYFKTSLPDKPLITVITVVFNGVQYLEQTILSVINQSYDNVEYIIIDGGSNDGTLDIVKKYEGAIDYWVSEPDKGIYDAMNKGICLSCGQVLGILNSGDFYTSNCFNLVVERTFTKPKSIIIGDAKIYFNDNHSQWMILSGSLSGLPYKMPPHTSVFVPLFVYKVQGIFSLDFKLASDYDFICRCYNKNLDFDHLSSVLTNNSPRGASGNYYLVSLEYLKIRLGYRFALIPLVLKTLFSFLSITIHILLDKMGLWILIEQRRHKTVRDS